MHSLSALSPSNEETFRVSGLGLISLKIEGPAYTGRCNTKVSDAVTSSISAHFGRSMIESTVRVHVSKPTSFVRPSIKAVNYFIFVMKFLICSRLKAVLHVL